MKKRKRVARSSITVNDVSHDPEATARAIASRITRERRESRGRGREVGPRHNQHAADETGGNRKPLVKVPSPAERPTEWSAVALSVTFALLRRFIPIPADLEADLLAFLVVVVVPLVTILTARARKP